MTADQMVIIHQLRPHSQFSKTECFISEKMIRHQGDALEAFECKSTHFKNIYSDFNRNPWRSDLGLKRPCLDWEHGLTGVLLYEYVYYIQYVLHVLLLPTLGNPL